ncbi:MAG: copper homeostasis protein CutC, partial [Alphaproteobacteria bacterium]
TALETAIELGFVRILTSGGQPSAMAGATTLTRLVERAAGRITVMPGGAITPDIVGGLLRRTGARRVHGSCSFARAGASGSAGSREMDGASGATSAAVIRAMLAALRRPDDATGQP